MYLFLTMTLINPLLIGTESGGIKMHRVASDTISCVLAFNDNRRIACATTSGSVIIYDTMDRKIILDKKAHNDHISCLSLSSCNRYLATCGRDSRVIVMEVATGKLVTELKQAIPQMAITFSPDSKYLCCCDLLDNQAIVQVWGNSYLNLILEYKVHTNLISSIAYNNDGTKILTASLDGSVAVSNAGSGQVENLVQCSKRSMFSSIFDGASKNIATLGEDSEIRLFRMNSKSVLKHWTAHTEKGYKLLYDKTNDHIISLGGFYDRDQSVMRYEICVSNVRDGKVITRVKGGEEDGNSLSLAFSSDGKRVFTSHARGIIREWSLPLQPRNNLK